MCRMLGERLALGESLESAGPSLSSISPFSELASRPSSAVLQEALLSTSSTEVQVSKLVHALSPDEGRG